MNFTVKPMAEGRTRLRTETRILPLDREAERRFRLVRAAGERADPLDLAHGDQAEGGGDGIVTRETQEVRMALRLKLSFLVESYAVSRINCPECP